MKIQNIFTHKKIFFAGFITIMLIGSSCTKLNENLNSEVTESQASAYLSANADYTAMLERAYRDFVNVFDGYAQNFALQEVTTDECIIPTRPSGWDDGGVWRVLHQHNWDASNATCAATWNSLNKGVFDATNILSFSPSTQVAAQARFLRAFFMYSVLDLFGQVPFREPGSNLLLLPKVYKGTEAIDFIINEVESVINDLPSDVPDYVADKNAAYSLLAKMYLNRGVYGNPASPTFDPADMNKVITNVDAISGKSLGFYWDNYQYDNDVKSKELLFTIEFGGPLSCQYEYLWFATMYSGSILPAGGGWSGWATTPGFYDTFSDGDIRKHYDDPACIEHGGYNVGFLVGQQYGPGGTTPIPGAIIVKEIPEIVGATAWAGVRVLKYVPDWTSTTPHNDWILLCYGDALLMKAEALLRTGQANDGLAIVNTLRANRSATPGSLQPLSVLTEDNLYQERGFELYWQGTRRTDMIRFGKFLDARPFKPQSDPMRLLFPIPEAAVLSNTNLTQNPGY